MLRFVAASSSLLVGAGFVIHASSLPPPSKSPWLPPGILRSIKTACNSPCPAFAEEIRTSYPPRSSTSVPARSAAEVETEPSTGIKFSKLERLPGATCDLYLLGLGVREKKIAFVSVKVYAVGFYANKEQLRNDSSKNFLVQGEFEKGLVIKLARDISGAQFSSALDEELKPRLKSSPDGEKVLSDFGKLFQNRSLKRGTEIYFTWIQPESLHVGISEDGLVPSTPTQTFVSAAFASSLFDVYLGESPVSPSLKTSMLNFLN